MVKLEQRQKNDPETSAVHRRYQFASPELKIVDTREDAQGGPMSLDELASQTMTPQTYDISYSCLIIPRFKTHYLAGDLAESLNDWMQKISIAFAWRLELVIIQPESLQWIITVSPVTAPMRFMKIIRNETSSRIMEEFPRIKRDNPSNDFWAIGDIAIPGTRLLSSDMVNLFIQQVRQKQGYGSGRW